MKADWIIRIELANFFDAKAELRGRISKGLLKDKIFKGVFFQTLHKEFSDNDVKAAIKYKFISLETIYVRNVPTSIYLWLEKECSYQPVFYKRWAVNIKEFLITRGIIE